MTDHRLGLRQFNLLTIFANSEKPLSSTEVAAMTQQTLGAAAHHVRTLAGRGLIAWAGERHVRGAIQTFYAATDAGREALERPQVQVLLALAGLAGHVTYDDLDEAQRGDLLALTARLRGAVRDVVVTTG